MNAIGSEYQTPNIEMNITKTYLNIASWLGKLVVPFIDFIFTTIFLSIGIFTLVVGEESSCKLNV